MKVRVTFIFEPEPEEADPGHGSGLTEEGHEKLMGQLMELGASDIQTEAVAV